MLTTAPPPRTWEPWVLFFGRVEAYKGVAVLLAAAQRQTGALPSVVLAGRSGAALGALPPGVIHLNRHVDDGLGWELFRRCRAVVLPYTGATPIGVAGGGVRLWQARHRERQRRAGGERKRRAHRLGDAGGGCGGVGGGAGRCAGAHAGGVGGVGGVGRCRARLAHGGAHTGAGADGGIVRGGDRVRRNGSIGFCVVTCRGRAAKYLAERVRCSPSQARKTRFCAIAKE
jgi:hypothetical protein